MRILGIDPGTSVTGWGVVDGVGNRLLHVANGCLRTRTADPLPVRLDIIFRGVVQVIQTWQPDTVAVEQVFVSRNVESALKLGHARGAAVVAAGFNSLTVHEYTPLQVKKSVVGYGQAEKHQVQEMIRLLLNLSAVPPQDAADALAIAICHLHHQSPALQAREARP
ncbi:MAG: crossover junction endodeoxyribonuclease RuvC [Magnetococcales bacterium]|nr:crossover junction endodeoxyribonuclease RuvC [Magnetococcales bacterium]NGZ26713.1 crossover junction endodeoxyribonuclease RuvC [Magnetococcales bacterium]